MPRVVVALSGGVDSAVAAARACARGDEVIGMTLRLYDARASSGSPATVRAARRKTSTMPGAWPSSSASPSIS